MDERVRERSFLEQELAAAIGTEALQPWYQPIVELQTGTVIGFEALARWRHPRLGNIPPDRFIPVAEECGLIRELSHDLLRRACRDARDWPADTILSFNISSEQLQDRTLGLAVLSILGESGFAPQRLEIEITESALVRDLDAAKAVLSDLRESGVRIALDDFGTGYSSLYHLRNFKFDKIKIDRSFVESMGSDEDSAAIVRALTGLGKGLGLTITAEGIERGEQREVLLGQGCQQGQGFLFSRTVPAAEAAAFFTEAPDRSAYRAAS
jgi:EAL domain-containing protein (putative c-di-GMP-specific phosphodiesterase class I)